MQSEIQPRSLYFIGKSLTRITFHLIKNEDLYLTVTFRPFEKQWHSVQPPFLVITSVFYVHGSLLDAVRALHKCRNRPFQNNAELKFQTIKPCRPFCYICEFFSDFLRMESTESSLKSRSIVETTESLMARLKPLAANTYRIGFRALLMYTRYRE